MSLYQKLKDAGCNIDHHESDLYVEASDKARMIIKEEQRSNPSIRMEYFSIGIQGLPRGGQSGLWLCIPFQYDPYWEKKSNPSDASL